MAKAVCSEWGRTLTNNLTGLTYDSAIHMPPCFQLFGTLYDDGHFVGSIEAPESSAWFGYTISLVWRFEDGSESVLAEQPGYGRQDLDNWAPVSGHREMQLFMRCTAYVGGDYCEGNTNEGGIGWDVSKVIKLTSPPVLGTLSNENKYDNNAGISASETSIKIGYNRSGGDAETGVRYRLNGSGDVDPGHHNPFTISNLSPGTSYNISVMIGNDAGWSEWKSITVRTLYSIPTISISSRSTALEDFSISWSSNRSIQTVQYSLDGGGWITYVDGINATSGTINISAKNGEDLYPNTSYTIKVRVKSTNTYDHRWSSDSNTITMTTLDRARLSSSANLTFGQALHIIKSNPSGNRNQVKIQVGNPLLLIKTQDSPSNNYNVSFTQTELDNSYKKFPNPANNGLTTAQHNQIPIKVTLITFGRSRNYTVDYDGTLTLTGDALTARTNVNGTIRRAKVWTRIGSETNPRRGVAWISTSTGVWRRGI